MEAVSPGLLKRWLLEKADAVICPLQDAWRRQASRSGLTIVNQKEIRFVGMRRTGNHALINWLMPQLSSSKESASNPAKSALNNEQLSGKAYHLNNVVSHRNPYRHKANNLRRYFPEHSGMADIYQRQADGDFIQRDCLLYSFEDWSLRQISQSRVERNRELYFGRAAQSYDVLVLRDPFNLFASRLKKGFVATKDARLSMVQLWLEYAREFVGASQHLNRNLVCINYNRWFAQESYRRQIAKQLNIPFSDKGFTTVSSIGGGSSFDGTRLNGDARSMDVTNRWQHFADDPDYRQLFSNDEVWEYSERIFGEIPGTEIIR